MVINFSKLNFRKRPNFIIRNFDGKAIGVLGHIIKPEAIIRYRDAYTGPRAPSARSISPTLPERSPTIPRAVLEERPCQPRRRAEPGISHRSRGWGCRWQSKQSPVIECDSGKSVIPPAWHRRFPRIPVPLHAGSSNPIQGHRGNRRD